MEKIKLCIPKGEYRPAVKTISVENACKDLEFAFLTRSNRQILDLIRDIACEYYDQEYAQLIENTMCPDFSAFIQESIELNGVPEVSDDLVFIQILQEAEIYYHAENLAHYIELIATNALADYFDNHLIVFDEEKYNPHEIIDCICDYVENLEIDFSDSAKTILDNLFTKLENKFEIKF